LMIKGPSAMYETKEGVFGRQGEIVKDPASAFVTIPLTHLDDGLVSVKKEPSPRISTTHPPFEWRERRRMFEFGPLSSII
jgi:hypothetical protein